MKNGDFKEASVPNAPEKWKIDREKKTCTLITNNMIIQESDYIKKCN